MRVLYIFILSGMFSSYVHGQAAFYDPSSTATIKEREYDKAQGSAYKFDDWHSGYAIDSKGFNVTFDRMNFNGVTNQVEVYDGETLIGLNNADYSEIVINSKPLPSKFMNRLFNNDLIYYNVIYKGEEVTYVEQFKRILEKEEIAQYGTSSSTMKFNDKSTFYFVKNDKLIKVQRKKKAILAHLRYSKLSEFIKKQKLKVDDNRDLVRIFDYFEQYKARIRNK